MPRTILGCRLDAVVLSQALDFSRKVVAEKQQAYIVTLNGEIAYRARHDQDLRRAINFAGLVVPDSTNIIWAARRRQLPVVERLAGVDLAESLIAMASELSLKLFLLGGRNGSAEAAAAVLRRRYPNIQIAVSQQDPDDTRTIDEINNFGANMLLVGYGAPKQETWLNRNLTKLPSVNLAVGVGGTFEMINGRLRRAPISWRRLRLEWLWRLILEPRRFKRIAVALVVFPLFVVLSRD